MAAPVDVTGWSVSRADRIGRWDVSVLVDPARLHACLRFVPGAGDSGAGPAPADVKRLVQESDIVAVADFGDRLARALDAVRSGEPVTVLIGEGTPPRPPKDGRVQWHVRLEREAGLPGDGRVDFYQQSNVLQVHKGDPLLTLVPAEEGAPGMDVYGKAVPVAPPARPLVRRGRYVGLAPDGNTFVAEADGCLAVHDDLVSIETALRIQEDVDFSVGNVDFFGDVFIAKSVLDNFRVRAGGDLTVQGNVGAAELECRGKITVHGGVTGRERGTVKAQGPVRVKYLNSANVQSGEDVRADSEILNSHVRALGSVEAGSVVGGEVIARFAVDAGVLGSAMQVATAVLVGVDYTVEARVRRLRDDLAALQREVSAVTAHIAPYLEDSHRIAQLPPHRREQLKDTLLKLKEQKRRVAEIERELAECDVSGHGVKGSVVVRRMIHPGVSVRIGGCRRSFTEEVPGPVRLLPNYEDEGIRIDGLRPDQLPAR